MNFPINVLISPFLEKRFDLLAGELSAEAAPVDLESVIVAGQQVSFMYHPRLREGPVEITGLFDGNDVVACAKKG